MNGKTVEKRRKQKKTIMKTPCKILFLLLTLALLCAISFVTVYAEDATSLSSLSTAKYPLSSDELSLFSAIENSSTEEGYRTYAAEFATVVYKDRNGNELASTNYALGESPKPPKYENGYRDGAEAFMLTGLTAEIDGKKYPEFPEITAMMLGKIVIMTPKYEKATFMIETSEKTTYYIDATYSGFVDKVNFEQITKKITLFSDFAAPDAGENIEFGSVT